MSEPGLDEMVDGQGGMRPQWRSVLGTIFGLGREGLAERATTLKRVMAEEGASSLLPGAEGAWRCDPIPLPLAASEFNAIATGLAQRARVIEAVLQDVYGRQSLLEQGALPPALVFGNPRFLRPCRAPAGDGGQLMQFYAADLLRGPDGRWRVLADRTSEVNGIAYALENRRVLGRVLPELFRRQDILPLRPFLESWGDALHRLLPDPRAAVALLTPGHRDAMWLEHVVLARELSCALVEGGDLTVRGGALYLKTLRGLQPIGVLLRREDGALVDPLELSPNSSVGIPGLLDAARGGAVRVVNGLGTGLAEAPGLAAFLPGLAKLLIGEELTLPQVETVWLGHAAAREAVLRAPDPATWRLAHALDERVARPAEMNAADRAALLARIAAAPGEWSASRRMEASVAPSVGPDGVEPRAVVLRVFLMHDGTEWRAMQGGLARTLSEADVPGGKLPRQGLAKDVWVVDDEGGEIIGAARRVTPTLAIRRGGDLPSRVADNFYWLGRYLERLEGAARLLRAAVLRIARPAPTPRDLAEIAVLAACLSQEGFVEADSVSSLGTSAMAQAVYRALGVGGSITKLLRRIEELAELLRDRLTDDMYATLHRSLRTLRTDLRAAIRSDDWESLSQAIGGVLSFAATVAGLAAENMVRTGGRMFLDLGRRVERAQMVVTEVACALEQPEGRPQLGRIEVGLRLALELRDSVITYRNRYLGVLQPAPALDLLLADEGNPRALAYQLIQARELLAEIGRGDDTSLALAVGALLDEVQAQLRDLAHAPDQAVAAAQLGERLAEMEGQLSDLSDRIGRRYFVLLPAARSVGMEGLAPRRGSDAA